VGDSQRNGGSSSISFVLNGKPHSAPPALATTPLLTYLRDKLGMRGTKDGCSEGQCGACLVAVSAENGASYLPTHACIRLLGTLHGQSVLTVEGIQGDGEANGANNLHPVQRAIVETSASQCGFCTPGFVISLYCLLASQHQPERDDIHYALAGNLCRCTGYRALLDAACSLVATDVASGLPAPAISVAQGSQFMASGFDSPRTLDELEACLAREPDARLIAGGTEVAVDVWRSRGGFPPLIYVGRVRELQQIHEHEDCLDIGAAVSMARVKAVLVPQYPGLAELFRRFGSAPIASVATLGGSVAGGSPESDMIPVLIALGAAVQLRGNNGARSVPVEEFYTGYRQNLLSSGEYIASLRVPKASSGQQVRAYKVTRRFEQDAAVVLGAFNLCLNGGRVVSVRISYGALSRVPRRSLHLEQALANKALDPSVLEAVYEALSKDYDPETDFRASADYRRQIARHMLVKLIVELTGSDPISLWTNDP